MTPCKDCNKNVQPSPDTTLQWTGGDNSKLGIENNTSMQTVVAKLIARIEQLEKPSAIEGASTDQILNKGNLLNLTSKVSQCSGEIVNRGLSYESKISVAGLNFSYNLSPTLDGLPSTVGLMGVDAQIVGTASYGPINLLQSNKPINGVTIPVDKLPVTATLKVFLSTTCGNIELVKRLTVTTLEDGTYTTTFDINDNNGGKEQHTQSDVNQILATALNEATREIGNLKAQVSLLQK